MCSVRNLIPDFTVKDICAHARPNSRFSLDSEGPVQLQSPWQPGCKTSECVTLLVGPGPLFVHSTKRSMAASPPFASGLAQLSAEHPALQLLALGQEKGGSPCRR